MQVLCPFRGRMTLKSQINASSFGSDKDTLPLIKQAWLTVQKIEEENDVSRSRLVATIFGIFGEEKDGLITTWISTRLMGNTGRGASLPLFGP